MTVEISVPRVLGVVRDFETSGGASIGLVAWELSVDESHVRGAWKRAVSDELLAPLGVDPIHREELWGLTRRGWDKLGVSPTTDRRRREAVVRLGILDRVGDPALTALTRIASFIAGGSPAAINIFDERYQLRVAAVNAPLEKHAAHDAMCRLVLDGGRLIVCPDVLRDRRFDHTSFVRGPEPVRFYASFPLHAPGDDSVVGTLCLFDKVPRQLDAERVALLEDLAKQVIAQVEFARLAIDQGQLATQDPLTGAANRLLLSDRMQQAFARQRRQGGQVLVIVLDIDRFKALNDAHGHEAGDAVLVAVAQRLAASVRTNDTVARLGGDEFAVIAELSASGTVEQVVARIASSLAEPIPIPDSAVEITVSLGTMVARLDEDPSDSLARADRAMYDSKRARH